MKSSLPSQEIFLHPGDFHFGKAPGAIATLLGSCVSITLWHPQHRQGGMCHILLPGRQRAPGHPPDGRFADEAVEMFISALRARGVPLDGCQVKLFGGGNMFAGSRAAGLDVGRRNIEAARLALARHRLTVMAEDVGGNSRRRLHMDLSSGQVKLTLPVGQQAYRNIAL